VDDLTALARAARSGDHVALSHLLEGQQRSLYATALVLLGSTWDAQDAVQETLMEACSKIRTLREPSKVHAWLARILINECRDALRRRSRLVPTPDLGLDEVAAEAAPSEDRALRDALENLDDDKRVVVALRFFLDLDYEGMSMAVGVPVGTVKSRLHRAVQELRAQLGEGRDGP